MMGAFYEHVTIGQLIMAALAGGLLGAIFSERLAPIRPYLWGALGLLIFIWSYHSAPPFVPMAMIFVVGFFVARRLLRVPGLTPEEEARLSLEGLYGTAKFADLDHLQSNNLIESIETQEVSNGY